MSKKTNPNSYFEKTFGKQAGEKSERNTEGSSGKKSFGDKKKEGFKDNRKSGAEGRFESRDRKPFDRKEGEAPRRRFDDAQEGKPYEKKRAK